MASNSDELEQWGADVISGRNRSLLAFVVRRILGGFSLVFRLIAVTRVNNYLSNRWEQADFATMIVSVGN